MHHLNAYSTTHSSCLFPLRAGDVWYFPANLPHSLVGLEPEGCLFVSGYKSPNFDELNAFSATSWFATLPVATLAQVSLVCVCVCGRKHTRWNKSEACCTCRPLMLIIYLYAVLDST